MGKVVKTVLKVAAVAAISYFAPPLAASALGSVGVSSALATTALSSAIGAGMGELSGVGWKAGVLAGGLGGANSSGLFGGAAPAAGTTGAAPATAGAAGVPAAGTAGAAIPGVEAYMATPGFTTAAAGEAAAAGATGAAAAPQTIGQALSGAAARPTSVLTGGISNITKGLSGAMGAVGAGGLNLGAVAPGLVAAGLTSTPGAAITRAQQAELARAQNVNAALTQQRLDQANKLIDEAAYYDPEYMARQAAEAAKIRGGIQETEGTRGLTGERLAAERRRYRLGTARTAGSAYQQGYGTGVSARTQTRQAGIQSIPTSYPTTTGDSSTTLANKFMADEARRSQEAGLAALFGQALNRPTTT